MEKKTPAGAGGEGAPKAQVTVNEAQVDLLLEMLKTADITSTDPEENKTFKDLEGGRPCAHMYTCMYTCMYMYTHMYMCILYMYMYIVQCVCMYTCTVCTGRRVFGRNLV